MSERMLDGLRVALAVAMAVLWAAAAGAADERPLTLTEALERADRDNPELASLRDRAAAQAARADATARTRWPRLALASDWSFSDNPARVFADKLNRSEFQASDFALDRLNHPDGLSHLVTAVTLEVPVDVFGKLRSRTEVERAATRASDARVREARQDVRLRVVEAFEHAVVAKAALRVAEHALDGARAREDDLAARVEQGAALSADRLRARTRRRQGEAERAAAREQSSIASAGLARAIGAPPGASLEPDGASTLPASEGTLAEWQQRAREQRGAVAAAEAQRQAAERALRGERRSALPDVGVYLQLEDDRGGSASARSYAVGGSLRWSVLDPARLRRIGSAASEARATENELRSAADQARLDAEVAWRRLASARERQAAAEGGAEEGREALRVVQERRLAGMATLTDELETEAVALAAELEELRTVSEVVIAEAALLRAAGGL
jgi:outer membrane protein TolC